MDMIQNKVIEMLKQGVGVQGIAKHLNITVQEVLDIEDYACEMGYSLNLVYRDCDDGQPDEYTEWQDYMDGDDWDHGQYDEVY